MCVVFMYIGNVKKRSRCCLLILILSLLVFQFIIQSNLYAQVTAEKAHISNYVKIVEAEALNVKSDTNITEDNKADI